MMNLNIIISNYKDNIYKYFTIIFMRFQIYFLILKELYLLIRTNNRNPAAFCSLHSMLPEDMVVNWALGLFVEKTGFTATEMKGFVNLSYVADHEIRNWDISNLAFSWKRTLLQNEGNDSRRRTEADRHIFCVSSSNNNVFGSCDGVSSEGTHS